MYTMVLIFRLLGPRALTATGITMQSASGSRQAQLVSKQSFNYSINVFRVQLQGRLNRHFEKAVKELIKSA